MEIDFASLLKLRSNIPYPHLYVNNFLSENSRLELRDHFNSVRFTQVVGGAPISDITDFSITQLINWRASFIYDFLIPMLDQIFFDSIIEKKNELEINNKDVTLLSSPKIGFLHLTKHNPGTTINSHRDDDRATYQFVIYLGDINDKPIETTELIFVNDIDNLEKTQDYSQLRLLSYGSSNNGFLCFVNQPNSYHCLSKKIDTMRLTIAGSVIHYNTD